MPAIKPTIGYCTNVHPGRSLEVYWQQLRLHAVATRKELGEGSPLPLGLWFSQRSAEELLSDRHLFASFRSWLDSEQLLPYTLNGFPQGDFHEPIVKHAVYLPSWMDAERVAYTRNLIHVLDALLPPGDVGTISTMPIRWGQPVLLHDESLRAAANLWQIVEELATLEANTGRRIVLCIEPEPGCALQSTADVVRFFGDYLDAAGDPARRERYLGVCHDICHTAVMFEDQSFTLRAYRDAKISVAKIQVSAALEVNFSGEGPADSEKLKQLSTFAEDRYLHQTKCRYPNGSQTFCEDLPQLLKINPRPEAGETWRVHFHVPVFAQKLGALDSTQAEILAWKNAAMDQDESPHIEVETYAWGVLPEAFRPPELSQGIAEEIRWVKKLID